MAGGRPTSWTYSDWRSQATNALRLSQLRLHLKELMDCQAPGSKFKTEGLEIDWAGLKDEIRALSVEEKELTELVAAETAGASATRIGWTRGRANQW